MTSLEEYNLNNKPVPALTMIMFTTNETTTNVTNTNSTVSTIVVTLSTIATEMTTRNTSAPVATTASWLSNGHIQIALYAAILLLAIIGNALVILTLIQNRRMRTITNVFLLNLAISDILLGVLCMPITLIGTLLRDFVFGEVMCKLLPYLQGIVYTHFTFTYFREHRKLHVYSS